MKKIKVLIVAGVMNVGGIENQLMHLLRNADKNKFQIDFTTTVDHPFYEEEIISLGAKTIKLLPTNGIHFVRYCKSLFHVLKKGNYDIVHSHELFHSGMVLFIARLAGVKHRFVHAHSCNQNYGKNLVRHSYNAVMRWFILNNATEFFACSSLAAKFLYGEKILNKSNYHLLVNSVDTNIFLSNILDEEIQKEFDNGWYNVLQVGRFSDEKNFLFTASLANECKKRNNGIRFLCVGNNGNDYEKQVRAQIEKYQIEENMILLGIRKDVAQIMKCVDAFILPSKYEGMPLTLIEAQASCLPCVVADTFSHEVDFCIDAVMWISLEDSISSWADAIEKAVHKGKSEQSKVITAIKKYGFDSKHFADRLCYYYQKACLEDKV